MSKTVSTAERAVTAVMLALLLATIALFLVHGARTVAFPFPLDYGEGPLLDQALRLADGAGIYELRLDRPPYTVSNYPPLYVALAAGAAALFGPAYWYGRLLSLLCTLTAAVACGAIVFRSTRDRIAATATGGCLLAMPYVEFWSALFRIDAMALALSLVALALLPQRSTQRRRLWLVALLLAAAAFTRQSYVLAAPLAAIATLAGDRPTRPMAVRLTLMLALLGGAGLLVLQWLSGGGFWFHVVTANINEFSLPRTIRFLREFFVSMPLLVALPLLALAPGRGLPRGSLMLGSYALGALLSGLTIGKLGSNVNYLLELCAACAIGCGWTLAHCRRHGWRGVAATVAISLQLALLFDGGRYRQHREEELARLEERQSLFAFVQATPGRLLADNDSGLLPLAGKPIEFQPFEMSRLAEAGAWEPGPFLSALERREYSAILMQRLPWSPIHRTRWTPAMLASIDRHYRASRRFGYTVVYLPREN